MKQFFCRKGKILLFLLCFAFTFSMTQNVQAKDIYLEIQQKGHVVIGTVVDTSGSPIIGASVSEVGSSKGTITNINGKFRLSVSDNAILRISFIGYKTVQLKAASSMNIVLEEDSRNLDEVIVVGYGTMKKSDMTGSVSSLSMKDKAETLPITSVDQFLQGRIAGVNISSNNGAPGSGMSIQIRGVSTISGDTSPLYVIDGFPIDATTATVNGEINELRQQPTMNPLASINPNDIESIEVLKDASATAIYGSRGTNGVVLITTKKGKDGKMKLNYNFRVDVSKVAKTYKLLNAYDYGLFMNELDRTSGGFDSQGNVLPAIKEPRYNDEMLEKYKTYSTDWQDLMYRTAYSQDHQIGIEGGSQKTQYNITAGYTNQKGIILNTGLDRYSFRLNLNSKLTDKLSLQTSLSYSVTDQDATSQSQAASMNQMIRRIITTAPNLMPGDRIIEDEDLSTVPNDNPYIMATQLKDKLEQRFLILNASLSYDLGHGLTLKGSGSYNSTEGSRSTYYPIGTNAGNVYHGTAFRGENNMQNIVLESLLSYNALFNKIHKIDAVMGYTYESRKKKILGIQVGDFPSNDLTYNAIDLANNTVSKMSSVVQTKLSSFLCRINYSLYDRYLVTVTGRYDGSSLLASGNQWHFFPSVAFAWRVNQENFLKNIKQISNLKLRLSYGSTGNQNINYAAPFAIMSPDRAYIGGSVVSGYSNGSLANSKLGWENTDTYNAGVDLGLFDNRVRISADYYLRETKNILMNFALPPSSGYNNIPYNVGEIRNRGFEFEIATDILNGPVKWSIGGNIYFNRNKVIDLQGNQLFGQVYLAGGGVLNQSIHITKEGCPIGSFYGYVIDGIYQNEAEAAAAPVDTPKAVPGSFRFKDISGPEGKPDGKITADDMTILGSAEAKFNYGINTDLSWKGFNLSLVFTGRQGGKNANLNRYFIDSFTDTNDNISQKAWNGRWQGEGTSNYYPAVDGSKSNSYFNKRFSNFLLEDASFFRLKTASLAYQFKLKSIKWISNIKLYATATNVFTVTKYSGYDPEVSITPGAMSPNVDYAAFPSCRTFSFGVNIGF